MKIRSILILALAVAISISSAISTSYSASFNDPSWPCIQRKVENLSLGVVWPHEIPKAGKALDSEQALLARRLALRRLTLDEISTEIEAYAKAYPGQSIKTMGPIFRDAFENLNLERLRLIRGIERYSHSQIALSKRIDSLRQEMAQLSELEDPDFDLIDELEEKLDWDERIFRDRAQSLTYVCESPILIEKRVYAIAQRIQQVVAEE